MVPPPREMHVCSSLSYCASYYYDRRGGVKIPQHDKEQPFNADILATLVLWSQTFRLDVVCQRLVMLLMYDQLIGDRGDLSRASAPVSENA
jgi:hypothetical protein